MSISFIFTINGGTRKLELGFFFSYRRSWINWVIHGRLLEVVALRRVLITRNLGNVGELVAGQARPSYPFLLDPFARDTNE
jgi:hypothetical protein